MDDTGWLANQFEANQPRLRSVAARILGSVEDADDAVQEAWLRLSTTDASEIENLAGWLTTVVSRICLNVLRARQRRPSGTTDGDDLERIADRTALPPEDQAILADTMGTALLIVLETLSPAERICFVLHDMFSISFEEIAPILGRSPPACRQLASRARRRVRSAEDPSANPARQREVVTAFLAAARSGDFERLLSLLHPDVTLVADAAAAAIGAPARLDAADDVASLFSGGARAARAALLDGVAGLVWSQGGRPKVAFDFTVVAGRVAAIEMIGDEEVLQEMRIELLSRADRS
ncbi:MAG TPA: sigma-70 family RNA polymerase sigma factor [Acidimicrobiales bacterium]|nr:sigma-70 family RNA polymerase sigma factor [Acidimicrobiales bacterium]